MMYELSRSQIKRLKQGEKLRVVIPYPVRQYHIAMLERSPEQYAWRYIDGISMQSIQGVQDVMLPMTAYGGTGKHRLQGISPLVGVVQRMNEHGPQPDLLYWVRCLIVTLAETPDATSVYSDEHLEWPEKFYC